MTERIARFNELTPSTLPFVEGRMEGHKERKNYSIVGPGVAEDSHQSVKISKPHGYNLGAVSANPKNGSGLHSHTTAEVFLIYSGKWRFYWGADGKNEIILSKGDIISMPTNMFRGFENAGDEEGLIFVILGNDDPGIITWVPNVLTKAKETGLALLDDNSLIDLNESEIPQNRKLLEPITNEKLQEFDNYEINEIDKFVCKFKDHINHETILNNGIAKIEVKEEPNGIIDSWSATSYFSSSKITTKGLFNFRYGKVEARIKTNTESYESTRSDASSLKHEIEYLKKKLELTNSNSIIMSHNQIANELGTAREVITRVLKKLETDGKLMQNAGEIRIIGEW